ncbi:MAG TPA: peptidylprolyl isomerase [Alphaproteobacteria bacterium]|nr:peptidylprolyl isomerase [Alphaproteobacteria bacterium]
MTSPLKRAGLVVGILLAALGVFLAASIVAPPASVAQEQRPHWLLQLKDGTVDIELLPEIAPKHVERIVALTNDKFYDGIVFHRVIDGFMAQSGDPTGTGMGGSDLPDVVAEFTNKLSFQRGIVGAARTNDPNTFNSQFFICFGDASFLDGQYTIFGRVVSGMEYVDNIARGEPPANPDKIISATIAYR